MIPRRPCGAARLVPPSWWGPHKGSGPWNGTLCSTHRNIHRPGLAASVAGSASAPRKWPDRPDSTENRDGLTGNGRGDEPWSRGHGRTPEGTPTLDGATRPGPDLARDWAKAEAGANRRTGGTRTG